MDIEQTSSYKDNNYYYRGLSKKYIYFFFYVEHYTISVIRSERFFDLYRNRIPIPNHIYEYKHFNVQRNIICGEVTAETQVSNAQLLRQLFSIKLHAYIYTQYYYTIYRTTTLKKKRVSIHWYSV